MSLEDARIAADHLRRQRRELVDAVTRGEVPPDAISADDRAAAVKVVVLAEAVPGVGKVQARRIIADLAIPDAIQWGALSAEDERRLVLALTGAGARPATEQ